MNAFFDPEGRVISRERFISMYEPNYYICGKTLVKNVRRSSCFVEKEIEQILAEGIGADKKARENVERVLAWNAGEIIHKDSQDAQDFKCTETWKQWAESSNPSRRDWIDYKRVSKFVANELPKRGNGSQ